MNATYTAVKTFLMGFFGDFTFNKRQAENMTRNVSTIVNLTRSSPVLGLR